MTKEQISARLELMNRNVIRRDFIICNSTIEIIPEHKEMTGSQLVIIGDVKPYEFYVTALYVEKNEEINMAFLMAHDCDIPLRVMYLDEYLRGLANGFLEGIWRDAE
jgi:hypothetical protein